MNIYSQRVRWKFLLLVIAIIIGVGSLYYTRQLVNKLAEEEKKKSEVWAKAMAFIIKDYNEEDEILEFVLKLLQNNNASKEFYNYIKETDILTLSDNDTILIDKTKGFRKKLLNRSNRRKVIKNIIEKRNVIEEFMSQIIISNETIPVILTDEKDSIITHRHVKNPERFEDKEYAKKRFAEMRNDGKVMTINFLDNTQYLYYDNSLILRKLAYFPYFQLGIILLFVLVAYFAFNASRNAEQNQVWVGLSKETAHQLGTPTSSMMAWVELLKSKNSEVTAISELDKDVQRLKKITDRFSKIGSKPKLVEANLLEVIKNAVDYIRTRSSNKVAISVQSIENEIFIPLNVDLFEWVIENICRNAIDAMEGKGKLSIETTDNTQVVYIDIIDTGKGIPKSKFKTVFKPGYTTKKRGWGLGLSLSKRIVENYHNGKIFVHSSEIGKGSRFRIVLKKFF